MGDWKIYLVGFLIGFFYWLSYWSFSGYPYLIGTLGGFSGAFNFPKICSMDLNYSLCAFPSVTSGMIGAGFFSA